MKHPVLSNEELLAILKKIAEITGDDTFCKLSGNNKKIARYAKYGVAEEKLKNAEEKARAVKDFHSPCYSVVNATAVQILRHNRNAAVSMEEIVAAVRRAHPKYRAKTYYEAVRFLQAVRVLLKDGLTYTLHPDCDRLFSLKFEDGLLQSNAEPSLSPSTQEGTAADSIDEELTKPLQDERKKKMQEIVERRGQPEFRNTLMNAYDRRWVVTGWDAVAALEAAHIVPYCGPSSNHITNGLLLRADIHTLFDLYLIGIDPDTLKIVLASELQATTYFELQGKSLISPAKPADAPNHEWLLQRWKQFMRG